ncbi:MAG: hypothetical protein ACI4JX_05790 [Oscillospiraceae bacterium]
MNNMYSSEIPMGLGMALAQNTEAMNAFTAMSEEQKQKIIAKTHAIISKKEMQAFVNSITTADKA